jgi:uncharacterized glyoxalase superfamily metalloenzyme YdcJ
MEFSLNSAAAATGKGKSTLHRAIKSGKLSATRQADGTYSINAAELFRVFPRNAGMGQTGTITELPAHPSEMLSTEVAVLRARLEAAEKLDAIRVETIEEQRRTIEDQRKRLDRAELLLTDQRGQPTATQEPVAGRSWWSRLLGRQ